MDKWLGEWNHFFSLLELTDKETWRPSEQDRLCRWGRERASRWRELEEEPLHHLSVSRKFISALSISELNIQVHSHVDCAAFFTCLCGIVNTVVLHKVPMFRVLWTVDTETFDLSQAMILSWFWFRITELFMVQEQIKMSLKCITVRMYNNKLWYTTFDVIYEIIFLTMKITTKLAWRY